MKKLGILVSGQGSNMTAILNACEQGYLQAEVEVVISSNPNAKALTKAKEKGVDIYSDPRLWMEYLPKETQGYLNKILFD